VRTFLGDARGQRAFVVFAPVQTDKTRESLQEISKEVTEYVGKRPTTLEEFDRIQADRVLKLPGNWETMGSVQGSIGQIVNYGLPDNYYQGYADMVRKLKREEIDAAARKVIKPQSLVWIVVGDRSKIEKGIAELKLGELKYADPDGNAVQ
jgi:zinc protease